MRWSLRPDISNSFFECYDMCRVLTPSIVKLYEADKARECESLMTLHTDMCYKLVSVRNNTDTDMLVEDHVDTTGMCYKLGVCHGQH